MGTFVPLCGLKIWLLTNLMSMKGRVTGGCVHKLDTSLMSKCLYLWDIDVFPYIWASCSTYRETYTHTHTHTQRHAVISPRMHLDIVSPAFVSRMKRWCFPSSLWMLLWSCLWCRTNLTPDVPVIPSDMGVDFSSILEAFWAFQCFHYIDQRGHDLWFPAHVFGAENNIYEMWMWVWPNNILDS